MIAASIIATMATDKIGVLVRIPRAWKKEINTAKKRRKLSQNEYLSRIIRRGLDGENVTAEQEKQ